MRIISPKFHDYYDISLQYGTDPNLVYVRQPEVVPYKHSFHGFGYYKGSSWRSEFSLHQYSCEGFTIGFCGKAYFGFKICDRYIYSIEDLDEFVSTQHKKLQENYNEKNTGKARKYRWWGSAEATREYYDRLFKRYQEYTDAYKEVFYKLNCPIFVVNWDSYGQHVTKNACLKNYEFQRIIDPYTAYQEISMFVGGVLAGQGKEIPIPDDKTMVEIKGFNKWSFRKEPKNG